MKRRAVVMGLGAMGLGLWAARAQAGPVLVIGAGLARLSAARALVVSGLEVVVLSGRAVAQVMRTR